MENYDTLELPAVQDNPEQVAHNEASDYRDAIDKIMRLSNNHDRELVEREVMNLVDGLIGDRVAKHADRFSRHYPSDDKVMEASKGNFPQLYSK